MQTCTYFLSLFLNSLAATLPLPCPIIVRCTSLSTFLHFLFFFRNSACILFVGIIPPNLVTPSNLNSTHFNSIVHILGINTAIPGFHASSNKYLLRPCEESMIVFITQDTEVNKSDRALSQLLTSTS